MKKLCYLVASTLVLSAMAMPANAATFMFNFTTKTPLFGPSVSGNGVFTTSDTPMLVGGQTAFSILSITGMVNGSAIVAPTKGSSYGNYFTTGGGFLDGTGTVFSTASGSLVSFFKQSAGGEYRVNTQSPGSSNFVNASSSIAAAVPEPTTWMLMLLGMAGIGFAMRRKPNQTVRVRYA